MSTIKVKYYVTQQNKIYINVQDKKRFINIDTKQE